MTSKKGAQQSEKKHTSRTVDEVSDGEPSIPRLAALVEDMARELEDLQLNDHVNLLTSSTVLMNVEMQVQEKEYPV